MAGPAAHTGPPVIFLHGFGGLAAQWAPLQANISGLRKTLAFDLPGHGGSVHYPEFGPPKIAARAVINELEVRNIDTAHFVGHSMGGAVSSLVALFEPERIASLTLLAPGGFGPEIAIEVLQQWAGAFSRADLQQSLPQFFAPSFEIGDDVINMHVAARKQPDAIEALEKIVAGLAVNGKQGQLPLDPVLNGDYPISLIWGDLDEIVPVSQAQACLGKLDLHILNGIGHMPAEEASERVYELIAAQISNESG